ncbi:hypothetical protein D3C85_1147140 [compost metagenome]
MIRIEEAADACHDLDLARLRHAGEAAGELLDHTVLEVAQRVDVDFGRAVLDAVLGEQLHLVHHAGRVQQRLGGDAAHVEADAAECGVAFDQHGLHAEVGAAERGRVAAGAGAEHEHLAFDVGLAGVAAGYGCGGCGNRCGGGCRCGRRRCSRRGCRCLNDQDDRALAHLVA